MTRQPLLISLACAMAFNSPAQTFSRGMMDSVKSAMVYIEVKMESPLSDEEPSTSGSGFFINRHGLIVTNYHVVQSLVSGYGLSYPAPVKQIRVLRNSGTENYSKQEASIVAVDKKNDLAILAIEGDTAATSWIALNTEEVTEASTVWAFGYPYGNAFGVIQRGPEISVNRGTVTALRHNDRNELTAIQTDAIVNPGNSGGPLLDATGRAVGVVNASGGVTRMNFAVPVQYVAALLGSLPCNRRPADSVSVSVNSEPAGASVYIDRQYAGVTPLGGLRTKEGWHTVSLLNNDREAVMTQETWVTDTSLFYHMPVPKTLTLMPADSGMAQRGDGSPAPGLNVGGGTILLEEHFNDKDVFRGWEQSTGGTEQRTWYLEDGQLRQYENNGTLHAIYLGDTMWSDYTVRARVKIDGGEGDSRAGIIFRETSAGFYLFRVHRETDKVQLAWHSKNPFGWKILAERKMDSDITDAWYTLTVHATGNTISCFMDSSCVLTANIPFTSQGRIGFYSVESKPSFDSLTVAKADRELFRPLPETNKTPAPGNLVAYWFSDNFNLSSVWWSQRSGSGVGRSPWHFSDAGCAQFAADSIRRTLHFSRYRLTDFTATVIVSLAENSNTGQFEMYFWQEGNSSMILRFTGDGKYPVQLVSVENGMEKVLEKSATRQEFFGSSFALNLNVSKGQITCSTSLGKVIAYSNKKFAGRQGGFGFSARGVKTVLHQLNVASVRGE